MLNQQLEPSVETAPRSLNFRKILMSLGLLGGVLFSGFIIFVITNSTSGEIEKPGRTTSKDEIPSKALDNRLSEMWDAEEFVLSLARHVPSLKDSILNLKLPDVVSNHLFSDKLEYNDLSVEGEKKKTVEVKSFSANRYEWSVDSSIQSSDPNSISLWQPFLQDVDYFEHAKFYLIKAHRVNDKDRVRWQADMGFQGLAKRNDGHLIWIHGSIDSEWQPNDDGGDSVSPHLLTKFLLKEFHTWEIPHTMFSEVLDAVILNNDSLEQVRHSGQEQYAINYFLDKSDFERPRPEFKHISESRHPAVSVVDLDRDGFDDLYIMPQWGKNSFLRNRGDGTFEEIAESLGLAIEDHCASAAFADFDNDGDYDLFLGRTLEPSMYLEYYDGKFHEKTLDVLSPRPGLVSSISVADYNQDGLLDVFITNYHPFDNLKVASQHLEDDDFERVQKIFAQKKHHNVLNRIGPPNILLVNLGEGRFDIAPDSEIVQSFRSSYQATWCDYDRDGDPDLYVASDFAPNNLFRNDGGKFVDVTEETGTSDIGFGMGISWGDYDNDGWPDIYVTNMYSKAGRRIADRIPNLDSRVSQMSRGNSLFRNLGPDKNFAFEKVSGVGPLKQHVEKAGWSWSGQFADFDNDGRLDIYALSGHFTLPKIVELKIGEKGADL